MTNKKKLVNALITARAGSKRLPNKNLKYICGKPLIVWSIEAAKNSKFVDKIYVSTDSNEIAEISSKNGALVPRLRSESLSGDQTSSLEIVLDFEEYFTNDSGGEILLMQPTSPLRLSSHIDKLMKFVRESGCDQCIAVREISKFLKLTTKFFYFDSINYIPNGSMYYSNLNFLKKERNFFSASSEIFLMDDFHSIDIDTQDDWNIAEACLKELLSRKNYFD